MKQRKLRALCEGAIFTALALILSYAEIPIGVSFGGFGGSLSFVMIPLILCAIRWGTAQGLCVGLAFGVLKYFFSNGWALTWESIILDYAAAYMLLGIGGLLKGSSNKAWLAALIACFGRFIVHFISGITIYAEYVSPIFGWNGSSSAIYSILYNGSYMLPNTVLTVLIVFLLQKPLGKFLRSEDIR